MAGFCDSLNVMVSIANYILIKTWWSGSLEDSGQEYRNLVASTTYYILFNFTSLGKDVIRITETLEKMRLR